MAERSAVMAADGKAADGRVDTIRYPFADYPAPGTATEVADGIFWLSVPVPFVGLKQVNVWLLRDGPGWTMIDCGYGEPRVIEQIEDTWRAVLGGRPITRLIVTHFHPDHAGNAAFISERWGLKPHMTQTEWFAANLAWLDRESDAITDRGAFYRRHGLPANDVRQFLAEAVPYKAGVSLPGEYRRIREGSTILIDGHAWQVVVGEGHSPEHCSLYDGKRRILIAGDQILPGITTNVSTWPSEPEFDAVGAFLATCRKFLPLLAPDTLILPSHRKPFTNVRARLRELAAHHADRLNLILAATAAMDEISAGDLIGPLFRAGLDGHSLGFAMGEIIAHLNHLVSLGHMRMTETKDSFRYARTATGVLELLPAFQ
jgi:glyoxylase-like metal-dependent hydrolase (beta-lactamase superfamily II)